MDRSLAIPDAPKLPAKLERKLKRAVEAWLGNLEGHTKRSYRRGLVHFATWLADPEQEAISLSPAPPARAPERQAWEDEAVSTGGKYLLGIGAAPATMVVEAFLHDLMYPENGQEAYTRSTATSRLAALKWAVREAKRTGQVDWTLEARVPKPRKARSGRLQEKAGRDMKGPTVKEAERIMAVAEEFEDPRAWFVLSLVRYEGFREHEVRQLNYEDIDLRRNEITAVRKKRGKPAQYPMSKRTKEALQSWLKTRGRDVGPLIFGGEQGCDEDVRIGETSIYRLVQRVCGAANVAGMSPHRIRHRALTDIVQVATKQGLPEEEILHLTGHTSRQALQPYYEASKSRKSARHVLDSIDDIVDEDEEDEDE